MIKIYYEAVTTTKKYPNNNGDIELEQDSILSAFILQANV